VTEIVKLNKTILTGKYPPCLFIEGVLFGMVEDSNLQISRPSATAAYKGRDWTQGSILKNLLSLSWPMVISNTLNVIGPAIDLIWMGKLGPDAIAAVGIAGMIVMLVNSFFMGIFTGLRSMVARFIGASDRQGAIHVSQQAFVLAGLLGLIMAIIGISLDRWMLGVMGLAPDVLEIGAIYMRINFIGMIAMSMRFTTDGIMQASGDTMNPMKLAVVFRLFHVVLSPALIFGWWIFPRMGAAGSATAMVFAQTLGTVLGLWILMSGRSRLKITFRRFRFDLAAIWRLVKIGIPASIMGMQMQFGQLIMTMFVTQFGTLAVAAHSLCQRIDMLLSMPMTGIGIGAGVLVGQNLGAHKPERAEKSGWTAVILCESVFLVCGLAIMLWPSGVVNVFSSDPQLEQIAIHYVRIAALGYMVSAFSMVLQQCISGAGDTIPPLVIGLVVVWSIQIPVGWYLSSHTGLGVYGVRWAVVGGAFINMISYVVYFRTGRWKKKKIW
jgi:putative MATE family efflux protein